MNSFRFILTVLALFLIHSIFSQVKIEGIIQSSETGHALPGVEIFNHQKSTLSSSNVEGYFKFEKIESGRQHFTFFNENFKTLFVEINAIRDSFITIALEPLNLEMGTIEIAAHREELFAIKPLNDVEGTSIFAGKKSEVIVMDKVKGNLALNNGRQVYAQVSGLNIYEGNDGGLQLNIGGRGLDPNRTSNFNTRQNGYDISADVLGYPENYYTPPSEAIEEIRILRGASSLQYGTQFGGLIDFRLRKIPSFKKTEIISNQTYGSFNTLNSFNSFGINKGKLTANIYYNFRKGDGFRANSEYELNNLYTSVAYQFSDKTKATFEWTNFNYLAKQAGGLTDQQFKENPRQSTRDRNWFDVNWNLFNVKIDHALNNTSAFNINIFGLSASRKSLGFRGNPIALNENPITALDEQTTNGQYITPRDLIIGNFKNIGAEIRYLNRYQIKDKRSVFLIGSKIFRSSNTALQGPGSLSNDANFNLLSDTFSDYPNQSNFEFPNFNLALFSENIFYINEKLSVTPGIRIEHIKTESKGNYNRVVFDNAGNPINNQELSDNRQLTRTFALAGIGINYSTSDALQYIFNISQNYRSVTFSDIRVVNPTFIVDPDINDENGWTADFTVRGRLGKVFSYNTTLYGLLYNDRIGIILDNRANRVRKNIGQAMITGTESLINLNLGRALQGDERTFDLNIFVNAAFTYSEYLKSEENNVVGKKVEFIPSVNIKSGIGFRFKNFNTQLQFTYLSEQYTDVQNSRAAPDFSARSGIIGEIPAYQIADWTLGYNFKKIGIKTGINNLFDHSYFTRRATGYPGPGIIPSEGRNFYITVSFRS